MLSIVGKIRVATAGRIAWIGLFIGICLAYTALQIREALIAITILLATLLLLTVLRARRIEFDLSEPIVFEPAGDEHPRYPHQVADPQLVMIELDRGEYQIGSHKRDPMAWENEKPHRIRVDQFAISECLVTRRLYQTILPSSVPSEWQEGDDNLPANHVSWDQALKFCNELSKKSGREPCYRQNGEIWIRSKNADGYRLPTEREWEYACRAGTDTPWFWGKSGEEADRYAWYATNAGTQIHPVAEKDPNPWGLYDMSGNVWEWCWDQYEDDYNGELEELGARSGRRVLRGGAFLNEPNLLRSARRLRIKPVSRDVSIGFRCVRTSSRQL